MALGVYKPGQGYWVRVLSAVGAGTLVLATAMWVWGQADTIHIPTPRWEIVLEDVRGDVQPGSPVELQEIDANDPTRRVRIGSAIVESFARGSGDEGQAVVGSVVMDGAATPADAAYVGTAQASQDLFETNAVNARLRAATGIPLFERLYLRAGMASVVILAGFIATFYFVGTNKRSAEFLIATDGEMKKVNWSTRREIVGSTGVVIFAAFLIAAMLYVVDIVFNQFFSLFGLHG